MKKIIYILIIILFVLISSCSWHTVGAVAYYSLHAISNTHYPIDNDSLSTNGNSRYPMGYDSLSAESGSPCTMDYDVYLQQREKALKGEQTEEELKRINMYQKIFHEDTNEKIAEEADLLFGNKIDSVSTVPDTPEKTGKQIGSPENNTTGESTLKEE